MPISGHFPNNILDGILLVISLVILMELWFWDYIVIDQNINPFSAFLKSSKMVKKVIPIICFFLLLLYGPNFAYGLIGGYKSSLMIEILSVGWYPIVFPFISIGSAYIYHKILASEDTKRVPVISPSI